MAHLHQGITLEMLEQAGGREQWSLSWGFRALYCTSPYRLVTLRCLGCFRRLILDGFTLVDTALASGFHDQSHMTRHFTRSYGVSPCAGWNACGLPADLQGRTRAACFAFNRLIAPI